MKVRRFTRKNIAIRKAQRVSELNTRRINKRKYYGVGVEIKDYRETVDYHFTHTSVIDAVRDTLSTTENLSKTRAEDYADDVVNQADFYRDSPDAAVEDLEEPLTESFDKGTRRAFNSQGDRLEPTDIEDEVNDIVNSQRSYLSQLDSDMRRKARQVIRSGVEAGLAVSAIIENLRSELKNLIDNRGSTMANSEVVKASAAGTMATFIQNGVEEVVWVSSQDASVCDGQNFQVNYNGRSFTNCRDLHGETFSIRGNNPKPVQDSHANCRCVLVSADG